MSGAARRPSAVLVVLAVLFVLSVALAACGGGGGGGGGTTTEPTPSPPPPPPPPGFAFTAAGIAGPNGLFLASRAATTVDTLVLELRANQVTDLYGVAFDLSYPGTLLRFSRVTAGPLLSGGAVQATATTPGTLVAGGTHLGSVPGATGSGVVLTLEFTAVAAGEGSFAFSRNSALDSRGQAIAGTSWIAGSVRVTR